MSWQPLIVQARLTASRLHPIGLFQQSAGHGVSAYL